MYANQGEIGYTILVTFNETNVQFPGDSETIVDISDADTKHILLMDPNHDVVSYPAGFYTDGTDGIIKLITDSGYLDDVGLYQYQGKISISGGIYYSDINILVVLDDNVDSDCS